ncbi:MAG: isoleucine--tRNA ligase [Pseudomonadota bacterium]
MSDPAYFKGTLSLPHTEFPMRGNMAKREPEFLQRWEELDLPNGLLSMSEGWPLFVLHDGPPYANGRIHYGHILNKVLKDIVVKFKSMTGHRAVYVPGWDCHGLPIELQVDRDLGPRKEKMSVLDIRKACKEYALGFADLQRAEFKRLGVFGLWEKPYLTLNPEYESSIIRELSRFAEKDFLYKGKKPVHWCASCRTALAEAEVEYRNHRSPSIYVKFRYSGDASRLNKKLTGKPVSFVIWTTTPWTLPANLAIALHPNFTYVAVEHKGEALIIAKDLLEEVSKRCQLDPGTIIGEIDTEAAEGTSCRHPFMERNSILLFADYVTLEAGTGCVHTAPGHGQEDYQTGVAHGLDIFAPVDEGGRFTDEVPQYAGRHVFETNNPIVAQLQEDGALLNKSGETLEHSYPHCWRCKNPVIFRATPQWFIKLDHNDLRERTLKAIDDTEWIPPWGHDRIYGMIQNRPDWCLSRQRLWGVPIPALYCQNCGEILATAEFMSHVADLFAKHGSNAWFCMEVNELLPAGIACKKCGSASFKKEEDIVDVWFESGVSWAAVCENKPNLWPIDLYLEGSDQHRGWFHSALLTSVATRGKAPYRQVLTHGFVVDEKGQPYSKSLKNFIPPEKVIDSRGAEIFRLWTSYVDYRSDMPFSEGILAQLGDSYRKIRNTCRFLLGNLEDFNATQCECQNGLTTLDRWALQRLSVLIAYCRDSYEEYEFHQVFRALIEFCTIDLSSFYLDVAKDRLYCDDNTVRLPTQAVLYKLARSLATVMAPILTFTAEDIWHFLPKLPDDPVSIHLLQFQETQPVDEAMDKQVEGLRKIRDIVLKELEEFRAQKHHSLDAKVILSLSDSDRELVDSYPDSLADLFIVSEVELSGTSDKTTATVVEADGKKCPRCWKRSTGSDYHGSSDVCPRCNAVLQTIEGTA